MLFYLPSYTYKNDPEMTIGAVLAFEKRAQNG